MEPQLLFHLQAALDDAGVPYSFFLARPLASNLAHKLTEIAIDLQIRLHEDISIGLDFLNSVQNAPDTIPDLLANTYGYGLSKRLKITREDANHMIAEAELHFRQLMVRYGELLNQQDSTDFHTLSEEGAALLNEALKNMTGKDVVIQPAVMHELMNLAMQNVEADYAQEISATISYLKKRKEISSFLKTILRNKRM